MTKLFRKSAQRPGIEKERGVALLTALLLLLLMTGLSLAMVMSVRSDLLVNGYYRNFRGAFYAADSGLNIVRQDIVNQLQAQVPASFPPNTAPIPASALGTITGNINTTYGANFSITGTGNAAHSWPESFKLDTTQTQLTQVGCNVLGGGGTCAAPTGTPTGYQYVYSYTLASLGQAHTGEQANILDRGNLTINVNVAASSTSTTTTQKTSFAAWGMFIDKYTICTDNPLVPGTISGPVFTNGSWNFGTTGQYIFTDTVGSVGADAGYEFSGGCDQADANQDTNAKTGITIKPTFQNGFNRGQNAVPLPPNDFSQKRAVLDGQGTDTSKVQPSDLNAKLRDISGTSYPSGGTNTGVFLPYTVDGSGNGTFTGGGIYVEGDAKVTLAPGATSNSQTYTIVQNGTTTINQTKTVCCPKRTVSVPTTVPTTTTTKIVVNNPTSSSDPGSTTMQQVVNTNGTNGTPTNLTVSGVPELRDSSGAGVNPATMLYVDGNVTGLSGPGQGQAAVQDGSEVTVTAANNVTITGDILYKTPPVTTTQNQIANTPADTLIPGNDRGQVLGIFTNGGNINLQNSQSAPNNLEIDASLATISATGTGSLINNGSQINNLRIVGGRIQNTISSINSVTRDVLFDRRFLNNGFAPPWFPSTTVTPSTTTTTTSDSATFNPATFQRVQWLYKANTY
jgi:Tfp pilus assembly protein PilX